MRMYRAPRNAALIGAFTLRFHLNARRGRGIRGDLKREDPTLLVPYRSRLLLADRTKRAIQGRRDARRPRGATSRRVGLSGFLASLSLPVRTNALTSCSQEDQLLPPPPHTPPSPAAHSPSLFLTGGSFLFPCTLSRETRLSRRPLAYSSDRAFSRTRRGHESTACTHVCEESAAKPRAGVEKR